MIARLARAARAVRRQRDRARGPRVLGGRRRRGERLHRLVAKRIGARTVVKSKSMATEETELNEALEAAGCQVVETDLGEWIIQLADQTPSHIIAPAVHLDRYQVARVPAGAGHRRPRARGRTRAPRRVRARAAARRVPRAPTSASPGATSASPRPARSCSSTNEGNGRLCTSLPRVHIAVMGMERVVADWEQLDLFLNLLARSGTGQHLSSYTNIITGPRREGEADGPDELHLVILDNGRSDLLGTEFQEMLPASAAAPASTSAPCTARSAATPTAGCTPAPSARCSRRCSPAPTRRRPSSPTRRRCAAPAWRPAR